MRRGRCSTAAMVRDVARCVTCAWSGGHLPVMPRPWLASRPAHACPGNEKRPQTQGLQTFFNWRSERDRPKVSNTTPPSIENPNPINRLRQTIARVRVSNKVSNSLTLRRPAKQARLIPGRLGSSCLYPSPPHTGERSSHCRHWPTMWPLEVLARSTRTQGGGPALGLRPAGQGESGSDRATACAPAQAAGPQAGAWDLSSG